jgi:hypothetical protein
MPTINKVSVLGFQKGADLIQTANRFVNIYITDFSSPPRNARLGTVLICLNNGGIQYPVAWVTKLYGHGVSVNNPPGIQGTPPLEVWIHWFRPGISYQIQVP